MGRITAVINDELDKEFRALVGKRYGIKKGTLSIAVEEAIRLWVRKVKEEELLLNNPEGGGDK